MPAKAYGVDMLKHRLRVFQPADSTGDYHAKITTFTLVDTIWCERQDMTVGETMRAKEINAEIDTFFTIRFSPENARIRATWRVALEDGEEVLTYEVLGVREVVHNRWLELQCVRRTESQ